MREGTSNRSAGRIRVESTRERHTETRGETRRQSEVSVLALPMVESSVKSTSRMSRESESFPTIKS